MTKAETLDKWSKLLLFKLFIGPPMWTSFMESPLTHSSGICRLSLLWTPQSYASSHIWVPPSRPAIKLNFDGCSLGNPNLAGFGGTVFNGSGSCLFVYSGPLGIGDAITAESIGSPSWASVAAFHGPSSCVRGRWFCKCYWLDEIWSKWPKEACTYYEISCLSCYIYEHLVRLDFKRG